MNLMLHSKVVYWRSGRGRVDHVQLMRLQTGRTPTSDVMVHTHACWTACRGAPVVLQLECRIILCPVSWTYLQQRWWVLCDGHPEEDGARFHAGSEC